MDETRKVTIAGAKAAIDAGKRLSIPQGKHLYRQYEEAVQQIDALRQVRDLKHRQLHDALYDLAQEKQHFSSTASAWNTMISMLSATLGVRVEMSATGDETWLVVETASRRVLSTGHESVTEAFRSALQQRLEGK